MSDYAKVPKEKVANLKYRQQIVAATEQSKELQAKLRERCKNDILYWVNTFVYLAEQREGAASSGVVLPFITFDFQDDALLRMQAALGKKIIVGDKSRDCGFTFMFLALCVHRCLFFPYQSFAVASRSDELVEKPGSPDCLFWKIDFMIRHLPPWMVPKYERTKKQYTFENHSDISGYATTKDIARGGRRLAILLDELAAFEFSMAQGAWAACALATETIAALSTQQGSVGKFAEACRAARVDSEIYEYIYVRWWMDPRKVAGLVWRKEGFETVPDEKRTGTRREMFDAGWKPWSDWYDRACRKLDNNQRRIAEEIDGDESAAGSHFFSEETVSHARQYCRPPVRVGRLVYDDATCDPLRFVDDPEGPLALWVSLGTNGRPVPDDYVNGVDVSAGVGATPSTMSLISKRVGEKVAEFGHSRLPPDAFARMCIAVSKWFYDAQLVWEVGGPGGLFTETIRVLGYRRLYYAKTNEGTLVPGPSQRIGWASTAQSKRREWESFRDALGYEYLERSHKVLEDCSGYSYGKDGELEQSKAKSNDNPKAARLNHGDYLTSAVLAWMLVKEGRSFVRGRPLDMKPRIVPGSIAWMRQEQERAEVERATYGGLRL